MLYLLYNGDMGKKTTEPVDFDDYCIQFLLDPKFVLYNIRPLQRSIRMPVLIKKSYPESNPGAWTPNNVGFYSEGEYTIDEQNNIYFKDPDTGEDVYLNKIDTASYNHKMYATYILNDLSKYTNTVKAPVTNRDTTVYARVGLHSAVESKDGEEVAQRRRYISTKTHVDTIFFNMNRKDGLTSNFYEILSTFRHEYIHVSDERDIVFTRNNRNAKKIYKSIYTPCL
jgi:hypothetical protein